MSTSPALDERPANTKWLPPGLRPPGGITHRQAVVFWLVGAAMLLGGYDTNVFFFAVTHVQASLHIPEDKIGLTVSIIRLASLAALVLAWTADLIGRRRLLLFTIIGQAIATLATAFAQTYDQFVWCQLIVRIFGYAEEMLCYVVIAEELGARSRGWAAGTLGTLYYTGGGITAAIFAAVNYLPYGWRTMYVIGSVPLFAVAYLRRYLPETRRFETREKEEKKTSRFREAVDMLRGLFHEHPRRIAVLLIAIAAYGFAIWPTSTMAVKYLESVKHLSPPYISLIMLAGGLVAASLNILAGRLSDWLGRRWVIFGALVIASGGYGILYSGISGAYVPWMWAVGFFGFVCADSLFASMSAELFPTAYRATVAGMRYVVSILSGALALALEGPLYNLLGGHGPALLCFLLTIPIAMFALLKLPEPAGRELEEIAKEGDRQ
jgi:putative MFS transporter